LKTDVPLANKKGLVFVSSDEPLFIPPKRASFSEERWDRAAEAIEGSNGACIPRVVHATVTATVLKSAGRLCLERQTPGLSTDRSCGRLDAITWVFAEMRSRSCAGAWIERTLMGCIFLSYSSNHGCGGADADRETLGGTNIRNKHRKLLYLPRRPRSGYPSLTVSRK
jgi:hypothetical protein